MTNSDLTPQNDVMYAGRVVVAGCGDMGLPMARRMQQAGFNVLGFDIRPAKEFGDFADSMIEDSALIGEFDVLVSVVRDETETKALLFNQQGVFRSDRHPKTLVICSTLSPRFIKTLAEELPGGVILIDAPMSGATHGAYSGELSFMIGGDLKVVKELMPLFSAMGTQFFYGGNIGSGMTLKVLNNYVTASNVVAVRRVLDMASALEVDHRILREVMNVSSGRNWFIGDFDKIEWSREGYDDRNTIGILKKDVSSALDAIANRQELKKYSLDQVIIDELEALTPLLDD